MAKRKSTKGQTTNIDQPVNSLFLIPQDLKGTFLIGLLKYDPNLTPYGISLN
jgi:hypothetical protein